MRDDEDGRIARFHVRLVESCPVRRCVPIPIESYPGVAVRLVDGPHERRLNVVEGEGVAVEPVSRALDSAMQRKESVVREEPG